MCSEKSLHAQVVLLVSYGPTLPKKNKFLFDIIIHYDNIPYIKERISYEKSRTNKKSIRKFVKQ